MLAEDSKGTMGEASTCEDSSKARIDSITEGVSGLPRRSRGRNSQSLLEDSDYDLSLNSGVKNQILSVERWGSCELAVLLLEAQSPHTSPPLSSHTISGRYSHLGNVPELHIL